MVFNNEIRLLGLKRGMTLGILHGGGSGTSERRGLIGGHAPLEVGLQCLDHIFFEMES